MSLLRRLPFPVLALVLLGALLASVRTGAVALSLHQVIDGVRGVGDSAVVTIVRRLRLPRALAAALVGAALAASGATFQALLRNALAEPYVLGVSGGAALGAVGALVLGGAAGPWLVPLAAFGGAVGAVLLVLQIARGLGSRVDTRVLLLGGVVVGAFANACILLLLSFADIEAFRSASFWMMGSLSGASWPGVLALGAAVLPGLALTLAIARALDLLALGEETAAYLGSHVERTKLVAYGAASLLAAASVAAGGIVGFVGLVVPHAVRLAWGSRHRVLLPASMLLGASFLLVTDTAARVAARPAELPLGAVTAVLGVPVFVHLLRRGMRR